jgi:transcriptional antiterminator Rof (Rho-off)
MGHVVDRSDFLDVLEESATLRRPVEVHLRDGHRFEDIARQVVTQDGEEYAIFEQHASLPMKSISDCRRAAPVEPTYAGTRGQGM